MADKLSPEKQAKKIKELQAEGMGHAEICRNHPELSDGWDVLTTAKVAKRAPRGGGAINRNPVLALTR